MTTAVVRASRAMRRPARSRALKPWYRNGTLVAGIVIVGLLILVAVLAPFLTPYDPIKQDLDNALLSPGAEHWLGTDKYGRDVLTRLLYGARVDLRVGFLAVLIPFVVGSVAGALAGYFGGWFDTIVMRIVDVFFAFPFYVLVIVLVFVLGAGESSIYLAIATYAFAIALEMLLAALGCALIAVFSHLFEQVDRRSEAERIEGRRRRREGREQGPETSEYRD